MGAGEALGAASPGTGDTAPRMRMACGRRLPLEPPSRRGWGRAGGSFGVSRKSLTPPGCGWSLARADTAMGELNLAPSPSQENWESVGLRGGGVCLCIAPKVRAAPCFFGERKGKRCPQTTPKQLRVAPFLPASAALPPRFLPGRCGLRQRPWDHPHPSSCWGPSPPASPRDPVPAAHSPPPPITSGRRFWVEKSHL